MSESLCVDTIRRCLECGMLFESDVADPGPEGAPRCPQCGLWSSEAVADPAGEYVVRKTTKFR